MNCLEWIGLYEAFEKFEARAKAANYRVEEITAIGDDLFARCPIPQPKPAPAYYEEYGRGAKDSTT